MSTNETPKLTGVVMDEGVCARCDRELGRVFEVTHPDGTVATYGRRCCAKVTGWKANSLERQVAAVHRTWVIESRIAKIAARFDTEPTPMVMEVVSNDRLWDGEDLDGHNRGFSRWGVWTAALEAILV